MGLIVEDKNIWGGPQPDFEMISVPGRDGDVVLDHGRYKNVEVSYTVSFIGTKEKAAALRQWLCVRADYGYLFMYARCELRYSANKPNPPPNRLPFCSPIR